MDKSGGVHIDPLALYDFTRDVFERAGFSPEEADDGAAVLLYASLRGVETHGVRNLTRIYMRQVDEGRLNLRPSLRIEHETPISARVDADRGLGLAAGCWGMRLAMEKAQQSGIGMVAMRNSWHYGAAGHYPWMAVAKDLVGISTTASFQARGSEIGVIPTFAAVPMFSTNPIAISFPTEKEPPYIFDMATSIVPFNRITLYRDGGVPVHEGWGVDGNGLPTTDADLVRALWPLGGSREMGGHKGTGLAMVAEVLSAVLSGEWRDGFGEDEEAFAGFRQTNDAHFFAALRVDLFRPAAAFKTGMDRMIQALHAAPKAEGRERIYVAGEIEHETEQERRRSGIPLPSYLVEELEDLARRFQLHLSL